MFKVLLILMASVLMQAVVADPTRPPAWLGNSQPTERSQPAAENYDLQQILLSDKRQLAIINGQVLAVGEKLSGAKVMKISADSVVIKIGSKRKKLRLSTETKEVVDAQ